MASREKPVVIFLNGTSSAGKSSISKQIQILCPDPVVHTGIDDFALMLPSSYIVYGERAKLGYQFIPGPGDSVLIQMGPVAKRLAQVKHKSMKAFLDEGFSLIVDELLLNEEEFQEYIETFYEERVLFVGVKPPLEVVEERERARGDRVIGLARGYHELTHQSKTYDLILDSASMTPEKAAQTILQMLATQPDSRRFQGHRRSK